MNTDDPSIKAAGLSIVDDTVEDPSVVDVPKGITVTGILAGASDTNVYSYNFADITPRQKEDLWEELAVTGRFDGGRGFIPTDANTYTLFASVIQIEFHPE